MICNDSLCYQFFKLLFSLLLKSYVIFLFSVKSLSDTKNKNVKTSSCINLFLQEIDFLLFFQIERVNIPGLPGGCL